ncbi:MAG TPA: hypothetical protein VGK39_01830 [Cyclobacteriaceae bacterium]
MKTIESENQNEEKLTWRGIWLTLKIGFFLAVGFNIGDSLWIVLSRIAAHL